MRTNVRFSAKIALTLFAIGGLGIAALFAVRASAATISAVARALCTRTIFARKKAL